MKSHPLLDSYVRHSSDYDEYLDENGNIRPTWKRIMHPFRNIPVDEFQRRNTLLQDLISDNGITYNVYSDNEQNRKWVMDLLPLVFSQNEWSKLESGLCQRAELINQSLSDLYGQQRALQEVVLPPYLVYANPAFLRPIHGINPVGGDFVNLYAADIARSPDGNWWVLSDRIEAASGMGYVLENRILSNRLFPEVFRKENISRLNPFYDSFDESIRNLNPGPNLDKRAALLTPGPANETFFEQSFLAKNLGLQLVEGGDLTVRENQLFFKTLQNIYPIRSLLRRMDSEWCDPLELRNDSLLGIPGMLGCLRSGNLGMVNMLGTGLMETVAMPAFLENLCQFHRKQSLLLPSVATWWCGQPHELEFVLENLHKLVIKKTFRRRFDRAIFGPKLSEVELRELKQKITESPENYCGQEIVSEATAPAYQNDSFEAHHFLIRVYLAKINGEFKMMPGGLARIASHTDSNNISMQEGAVSKDIWVLNDRPEKTLELTGSRYAPLHPPNAATDDISSRTANDLYWLGRYMERNECLARHLRLVILTVTEDFHEGTLSSLRSFLSMLMLESEYQDFRKFRDQSNKIAFLDSILLKYVEDTQFFSSLASGINNAERIAFNVKDRLSSDTWQIITNLQATFKRNFNKLPSTLHERSLENLETALDYLSAFSGKTSDNMVRTLGWQFLMLGKRVERSYNLINITQHSLSENKETDELHLRLLLEYTDSIIAYRNVNLNYFEDRLVYDHLLNDYNNPRSLSFNLELITKHLAKLPWDTNTNESHSDRYEELVESLLKTMDQLAPNHLFSDGATPLEDLSLHLSGIHDLIEQRFFAHT